jgi:hypothetical protein
LLAKLKGCKKGGWTYGDGVGDLADNALVGSVGVRGRHVDGLVGGVGWFECVFELLDESVCVEGGREQEGEEVNKGPCEGGRQ